MKISVIASGSNGNSCLVEHKNTQILIDAGKSAKEIELRMNSLGKSLENVDAIILSHNHSDHTQGIGPICRRYNVPVYMTKEVYAYAKHNLGKVDAKFFNKNFKINNLTINPIKTSHDVPSCGFVIDKFGLFTDTGIITNQMQSAIKNLKGILLESNHDIDMLINGPYPAFLKQRIFSDNGHLSNIHASQFIKEHGKHIELTLLGHLSENNNTVDITKQTFESIVKKKIEYSVLNRNKESGTWII